MSDWQPIETAPEGRPALLFFPANNRRVMSLGAMMRVGTVLDFPARKPTHWMPLPEPPQDAAPQVEGRTQP
jgi:hypothetical protein